MRSFFLLLLIVSFYHSVQAQLGSEWRGYSASKEGSYGDMIIIDSVLWLSGGSSFRDYGLVKYDIRTKRQELSSPLQLSLPVKDKNGHLWAMLGNALYKYDQGQKLWQLFPIPANVSSNNTPIGPGWNEFSDIVFDDNNNMWIAAVYYIWKYDGVSWTSFSTTTIGTSFIYDIAVDSQNIVWAGSNELSIASYDGTTWMNYSNAAHGLSINYGIGDVYIDADNKKWWGLYCSSVNCSDSNLYLIYNDTSWNILTENHFNNTKVGTIAQTGDGSTFWAIKDDGNTLLKYTPSGYSTYLARNYGVNHLISGNTIGINQELWLSNYLRGYMFDGNVAQSFNYGLNSDNPSNLRDLSLAADDTMGWINGEVGTIDFDASTVNLVKELAFKVDTTSTLSIFKKYYSHMKSLNQNDIWVVNTGKYGNFPFSVSGTDTLSLFHYNGSTWIETKIDTQVAPNATRVTDMAVNNNNVWLTTTSEGLLNWNGSAWTGNYPTPLNGDLENISITNTGTLWLSGNNQLFEYDGTTVNTYDHTTTALPDADITALRYDNTTSTLWATTDSAGLIEYTNGTWTTYNTQNSGIATDHLLALALTSTGEVWLGSRDSGLVHYDGTTTWKVINTNTPNSPMVDNEVATLEVDSNGNVWFFNDQLLLVYQEGGLVNLQELPNTTTTASVKSYPNPFSYCTTIEYNLEQPASTSLMIYDVQGRVVEVVLQNQAQDKGVQQVEWQPDAQLVSGLYFYGVISEGSIIGAGKLFYRSER